MNYKLEQIERACIETGERFEGYYLDWLNKFISVQGYADHHGLTFEYALKRISIGQKVHNQNKGKGSK
jgi:hypothetical protein